jgi:hypothetical protein
MSSGSKLIPARLRGRTVRQIESVLIAHRVDRVINEHVERPDALRRVRVFRDTLSLAPKPKLIC